MPHLLYRTRSLNFSISPTVLKRFYGTAATERSDGDEEKDGSSDLDYFDQAIRELEEALKGREDVA